MVWSGRIAHHAIAVIGAGSVAGAILVGGFPRAIAQPSPTPPPPTPAAPAADQCTAANLARVSSTVASGIADYLDSHPDVNDFFTGLHGQPTSEIQDDVRNYMNVHPQVQTDITSIRQPLTDLRNNCQ
jgi:hemophore-related protein